MRKKLREIMDKEEGFTLVELLAVIVILGIIVAIAIPAIGNVINKAETGATEAEKELVVDAARLYVITDLDGKIEGITEGKIKVSTLREAGYLESNADKKIGGKKLGGFVIVKEDKVGGSGEDKDKGKGNFKYDGTNVERE